MFPEPDRARHGKTFRTDESTARVALRPDTDALDSGLDAAAAAACRSASTREPVRAHRQPAGAALGYAGRLPRVPRQPAARSEERPARVCARGCERASRAVGPLLQAAPFGHARRLGRRARMRASGIAPARAQLVQG